MHFSWEKHQILSRDVAKAADKDMGFASKTHIFVCSLGYIPGKYLMFFPGEMHESVEHAFYISQPTREIALVPWFRTCSVMALMYWLEH